MCIVLRYCEAGAEVGGVEVVVEGCDGVLVVMLRSLVEVCCVEGWCKGTEAHTYLISRN